MVPVLQEKDFELLPYIAYVPPDSKSYFKYVA